MLSNALSEPAADVSVRDGVTIAFVFREVGFVCASEVKVVLVSAVGGKNNRRQNGSLKELGGRNPIKDKFQEI